MELRGSPGGGTNTFLLELWRFYEFWDYVPSDADSAAPARLAAQEPVPEVIDLAGSSADGGQKPGVKERMTSATLPREMEEVRLMYAGDWFSREIRVLRLGGLQRTELNQTYVADEVRQIGDQPTWWSADGCYFLYYVPEHRHWKANAVRLAGGEGLKAVAPGGRREGRGWAHSGVVEDGQEAVDALFQGEGWFECVDHEWEPLTVRAAAGRGYEYRFHASECSLEEKHIRGAESSEEHTIGNAISFCGWRLNAEGAELRLVLPPPPERLVANGVEPLQGVPLKDLAPLASSNFLGDVESLLLRPCARL